MKTVFLRFSLCVIMTLGTLSVFAQADRQAPQRQTPQQFAEERAGRLEKELGLTEKQRKDVYKIYLTQGNKLFPTQSSGDAGGGRGSRGGGGTSGGGGDGDMSLGGGGSTSVQFGPSQRRTVPAEETEKDIAKREKKMKKILTDEQYALWTPIESELNAQEKERQAAREQGGNRPQRSN